ncbi:MAG: helix-turn-helix transcriptional regulator [Pseudonocardiaceae bacterium]
MGASLLTLNEVATMLRTPPATLRFWRHEGTGPRSFKIGRRVMYREADVTAWLDQQYARDPRPAS